MKSEKTPYPRALTKYVRKVFDNYRSSLVESPEIKAQIIELLKVILPTEYLDTIEEEEEEY
jgi:hypothetical protein